MPTDEHPMKKAEKEIGKNIPEEMKGLDTEDVGDAEESKPGEQAGKTRH